jgi:hypothetical protein
LIRAWRHPGSFIPVVLFYSGGGFSGSSLSVRLLTIPGVDPAGDATHLLQKNAQGDADAWSRRLPLLCEELRPLATTILCSGAAVFVLTGCVSSGYKAAAKDTPPAIILNLAGESPAASALLHSVIVYRGPGSWKKEAYWDEYIITFTNRTAASLTLEAAVLFDLDNSAQGPGSDPWNLENLSRKKLKQYKNEDRIFLLGAGFGTLWLGSGFVGVGALFSGSALGVAAAGAVVIGLPVLGLGTIVRSFSAKGDIAEEFQRRRLSLPATLAANRTISGSLFFPVSPGPKRLVLRYRIGDAIEGVTVDLAPLAGLHLPPEPAKKP